MSKQLHALQGEELLQQLSASAMALSSEGMMITDASTRILAVNPAMCEITGYPEKQMLGSTPQLFKSGYHGEQFYKDMWEALATVGSWQGEILDRKPGGEIASRQLRISAVRDEQGETTHYIGLMQDNSQLAALTELANKDPLTGLPNRRLFDERLQQAIARSKRSDKAFALLFIDLDDFKRINDNCGHIVGDKVLKTVAKRLRDNIREDDTVARLGGDEFAIILSEVGDWRGVEIVRDKIIERVADSCLIHHHKYNIGCSVGYCIYPEHSTDIDQLLSLADQNMFMQKKVVRLN